MKLENGEQEPLIGYVILEQSQAAVDMLGHRLIPIERMDLKWRRPAGIDVRCAAFLLS